MLVHLSEPIRSLARSAKEAIQWREPSTERDAVQRAERPLKCTMISEMEHLGRRATLDAEVNAHPVGSRGKDDVADAGGELLQGLSVLTQKGLVLL